ncbi:MAG TPA: hypothetical protein VMZ29_06745 [Candidatus Bathyarchaeia archaeon]|nr:hypothetical protein [Candidatus Bathyarchaeia archaeon]
MITKQKSKLLMVIPLLVLAIAFLGKISLTVNAAEPTITAISHQPETIGYQTNVTITINFVNDENVTGIQLQYCSLEPIFLCHIPNIDMVQSEPNTWSGSFIVAEEEGTLGYKLYITHTGGSMTAPNSSNYLGKINIVEPSTNTFYFSIDVSTELPTDNTPLNFGVPGITLAYLAVLIIQKLKTKK